MKRILIIALLLMSVSTIAFSFSLQDNVEEYVLANGMKFLLLERHYSPTFAGLTIFRVGGVDESTGKTGLAHMFEHMAFKGTTVIGSKDWEKEKPLYDEIEMVALQIEAEKAKGPKKTEAKLTELASKLKDLQEKVAEYANGIEFSSIYEKNGAGMLNAGTGKDTTLYLVELPSNRLELWMLMESERLKDPVFREFYKERDVVAEERRTAETSPGSVLYEKFMATAFDAHPYGVNTLGWMSDIQSLTRTDAEAFHRKYYVPSNSVSVIVGDIDIQKTKKLIDTYFGDIPASEPPPEVSVVEPPQSGEKRLEVEFDAEPQFMMGYHVPNLPDPEAYALNVLAGILSGYESSILDRKLIHELHLARFITCYSGPGERYPNLLTFSSQPIAPHTCGEIEKVIAEEIEKIKNEPVPAREFHKVINQLKAQFIYGLQHNLGIAFQLGFFDITYGGWRNIDDYIANYTEVTPEQVMQVAQKYLTKKNRTVATLVTVKPDENEAKEGGSANE